MLDLNGARLAGPLLLAPIAGYTDSPFRRIARRYGAGLTVTELISAEGIVRGNRATMELLSFTEEERPLAVQIFGKDPAVIADAAARVEDLRPDLIDLNFGCPAPKVSGHGSGAALLKEPEKIRAIVDAVRSRVKLPVSAKIRIGWDEKSRNYLDVLKALEDGGVSLVFVHGRTRSQQYRGLADWDAIREIRERAHVPVVGNGDIVTHGQAFERMSFSGCPAVMIGRGALGNPWIFSGRPPGREELTALMREHLDLMLATYGPKGLILMRKHITRYIHGVRHAARLRAALMAASTREEVFAELENLELDTPPLIS